MQLPSVDRTPTVRPAAESVSPAANRVTPVAAVNPPVQSVAAAEPSPSVINMVNPALKTKEGEPVYTSVSDPARPGFEDATAPKDWTIRRSAPEKVEDPPPKPMSQILMDHLRLVWTASASAIHLEQAKDKLEQPLQVNPSNVPGALAKEVLTYEPAKIKKNEKI
jgi:hypothetical protein